MLGALVAVALTLVAGSPSASGLTDDQLAGARVITGFAGRHPPAGLRRMISAGEISGAPAVRSPRSSAPSPALPQG